MDMQGMETDSLPAAGAQGQLVQDPDALYQQSLGHFQNGEWQQAIAGFEQVLQLAPGHAEARAFLEEARLKASLDQDKPKPKRMAIGKSVRRVALLLVGLLAVLALLVGARWAYQRWVTPQKAQQQVDLQRAQQLAAAQSLLAERDYAGAEQAFQALLELDPNSAQAQQGLAEAQKKLALNKSYLQAQQASAGKDWDEAARILSALIEQDPSFKDAQAQLANVQAQQRLGTDFVEAERAFSANDWSKAIAGYEALRKVDPEYQAQAVTDHLFESYLRQGLSLVASVQGSGEPVQEAQALYKKALVLKPQQPEAAQELALADKYLEGQTKLAQGDTAGASAAFEWVLKLNPDYANGSAATLMKTAGGSPPGSAAATATPTSASPGATPGGPAATPTTGEPVVTPAGEFQAKYAAVMAEGDQALSAGDYAQAEEQYSQAILAAVHGGYNSARWLFAAYVKLASANARDGKRDLAVGQIKTAIGIMTRSAVAIPTEAYSSYVSEGDRFAQQKDLEKALAQYSKALQVIGAKCNCGLENWSILP